MSNHKTPISGSENHQSPVGVDEKIAAENVRHREFINRQQKAAQTPSQQLVSFLNRYRLATAGVTIFLLAATVAVPSILHRNSDSTDSPANTVTSYSDDDAYVIDKESYDVGDETAGASDKAGSEASSGAGHTVTSSTSKELTTPSGIRVTAGPTTATVQWNSASGATQYDIQISRTSSIASPKEETSGVNRAIIFGLKSSTTYYIRVRSVGPQAVSSWSAPQRFATTKTTPQVHTMPLPGVVSGVKGAVNSPGSVSLTWSTASHAQRYIVTRAANSSLTSDRKEYSSVEGTKYTMSDLRAGTVYYFAVRAVNIRGTGPTSTVVSYKTRLTVPSIKSLALLSDNGIRVTYQKSTGAVKYQVRVATSGSFSSSKVQTSSQASVLFPGLKPLTRYYFQVRAIDSAYTSGWSVARDLKTAAGPRQSLTATFSFQNLGRERVSPINVFQKIKNSLGGRTNVVYSFAEIDAADPFDEHAALKKVFGSQGWSWFTTNHPILARLNSEWTTADPEIVKLHDGGQTFRAHGCPTNSKSLMIAKYINKQSSKTKFAVIDSHFIGHAYQSSNNAWCRGYWDRSWIKLKDRVKSLTDRGYDTIITADFNHNSSNFPFLHTNAKLIFKSGPDVIFAIPTKGRSVEVEGKGAIATPTGESFHKDIWAKLTFKGR